MPIADRYSYSLGLALSGGGFRGLAHIGVVRALEFGDRAESNRFVENSTSPIPATAVW